MHIDPLIEILRHARHQNNWSQADVAERLGCQQTSISHWENGKVVPALRTLRRWAALYGYDIVLTPVLDA